MSFTSQITPISSRSLPSEEEIFEPYIYPDAPIHSEGNGLSDDRKRVFRETYVDMAEEAERGREEEEPFEDPQKRKGKRKLPKKLPDEEIL